MDGAASTTPSLSTRSHVGGGGGGSLLLYVLMTISLLALIGAVVAVFVSRSRRLRDDDEAYKKRREGFSQFEDEDVRHPKNGWYYRFIKTHFSDGSSNKNDESEIMFNPSVTDVACVALEDDVRSTVDCSSAHLDSVSVRDRSPSTETISKCHSLATSREPLDPRDAEIRILDATYTLRKACIRLNLTDMIVSERGEDMLMLRLPKDARSTLFVMLSRPVFMVVNGSHLYQMFQYPVREYVARKDMLPVATDDDDEDDDDEDNDDAVQVTLQRVSDERIWKTGPDLRHLHEVHPDVESGATGTMSATFYYLNYEHPSRVGLSEVSFPTTQVATLVFRITRDRLDQSTWLQTTSPSVRVTRRSLEDDDDVGDGAGGERDEGGRFRSQVLTVNVAGTFSQDFVVGDEGYFVVVCSTDVVNMCYMTRTYCRVSTSSLGGGDRFSISESDRDSFESQVRSSGASPPAAAWPNSLFGIPNLYDLYVKLVSFG